MKDNEIIGINIRRYRKAMDKNQQEIADYLGISREELSYYETGSRNIPTNIISGIAEYVGIDEYDLYEEDSSKTTINMAFAFRAEQLSLSDIQAISSFKKIAMNYLKMLKIATD